MTDSKTSSSVRRAALVALLATIAASCSDSIEPAPGDPGVDETTPARVVIEPGSVRMTFSLDTVRLAATVYNAYREELDAGPVAWSSSDTAVATVDAEGLVYTKAPGSADISAAVQQVSGSAAVDVSPGNPLYNECLRCHFRSGHTGWSAPAESCSGCHLTDVEPHTGIVAGHGAASGGFELSGAHVTLPCTQCHADGGAAASVSDTECIACHEAHYQSAHPDGWPTACVGCHTTDAWLPASFEHEAASGGFRLLEAHADLVCTACHDADTFAPLYAPQDDQDCIACHQIDYDAQHAGSGYPTTCLTCHTMTTWLGATFDHDADYFPVYSGTHAGKWSSCETCHTDAADYGVFTCFNCHKHNQTAMDQKHSEVDGYGYVSTACLGCHPNGEAP